MKFILLLKYLTVILLICLSEKTYGQFWKRLSPLNERDLFEMEAKAGMTSGICYKEVVGKSNDPELQIHTYSYCCDGYQQNSNTRGMQCDPICTEDCTNGICTAPETCECYPGFMRMGGRCEDI